MPTKGVNLHFREISEVVSAVDQPAGNHWALVFASARFFNLKKFTANLDLIQFVIKIIYLSGELESQNRPARR